jgi:hypothetical protein
MTTIKQAAKQISKLSEEERIKLYFESLTQSYIVIPRKNIDEMSDDWKDVFIDLLDYLPALKDNYSVRERGDNGQFIAGEG